MKIAFGSDLHLEIWHDRGEVKIPPGADLVVLAGDIAYAKSVEWLIRTKITAKTLVAPGGSILKWPNLYESHRSMMGLKSSFTRNLFSVVPAGLSGGNGCSQLFIFPSSFMTMAWWSENIFLGSS